MLRSLFIDDIAVAKTSAAALNSLGENVISYGTPTSYIKSARVERTDTSFKYNKSGQEDNKKNIIYVFSSVNVDLKDKIQFPIGTDFGTVISKNAHYKATSTTVDFYELVVEII